MRTHKSNDIQAAPSNDHLLFIHISCKYLKNKIGQYQRCFFFILRYGRGFLQCPHLHSHLKRPQLVWRLLKCRRTIHSRQKLKVSLSGFKTPKSLQEAIVANFSSFFYKPFPIRIHCEFPVQRECVAECCFGICHLASYLAVQRFFINCSNVRSPTAAKTSPR